MNKSELETTSLTIKRSNYLLRPRSVGLSVLFTIAIYGVILSYTDWTAVVLAIESRSISLWSLLMSLALASYLARFVRWSYFMSALGYKLPILQNLEIYLAGFALTLSPGKVGEMTRSVYLLNYGVLLSHSIASFVSERILDLVVIAALASLTIFIVPDNSLWMLSSICCIVLVILFFHSSLIDWLTIKISKSLFAEIALKIASSVRFLLSRRQLSVPILCGLIAWAAQGLSLYFVANSMNYDLPIYLAVGIYSLSILAGAVSFIPGGIGATEIAMMLLLSYVGLDQVDALTVSIITRGATLWLAVCLGVVATTKITFCYSEQTRSNNI